MNELQGLNELQGTRIRERIDEPTLIAGYAGVRRQEVVPFPRVEPCACGGSIYVDVQSGPNIQAAVRRHQDTARHRIWSADEYGP